MSNANHSALSVGELKALGNDLADILNTRGIQKQVLSFMNLSMMQVLKPQVLESLGILADSIESNMEKIDHIAALLLENDKPEEVKAMKQTVANRCI